MANNSTVVEFVRNTRTEERLRIVPEQGESPDAILELLNNGDAFVSGDSLLQSANPPDEGNTVLGKVLSKESPVHSRPWRKLGAGKTSRHIHEPADNGHPCPSIGSQQHLRAQADQLRYRADLYLHQVEPDVPAASSLLRCAAVLLEESGGFKNLEGVWFLAAKATVADYQGNHTLARLLLEQAAAYSGEVLGDEHPSTPCAHGNIGQFLIEHGDSKGKLLLEETVSWLRKTKPVGVANQSWIDAAILEFDRTLQQADDLIAAWNQKITPQATPACPPANPEPNEKETPAMSLNDNEYQEVPAGHEFVTEWQLPWPKTNTSAPAPTSDQPAPVLVREVGEQCSRPRHPGSVWLDANAAVLPAGKWVAADANGLVAQADDADALHAELAQRGIAYATVAIMGVPENEGPPLVRQ